MLGLQVIKTLTTDIISRGCKRVKNASTLYNMSDLDVVPMKEMVFVGAETSAIVTVHIRCMGRHSLSRLNSQACQSNSC